MISLATILFLSLAKAAPQEERVMSMPLMPAFNWGLYSGYVPIVNTTKNIHYMFVESQNDPVTDPLLIWYNGGPGCSSMLAFLQEHGPYLMNDGASTFHKNDYSWNYFANVLYIEQPAGVGYSYCNYATNPEDCNFDDNTSGQDNLAVILAWFEKYPEYKEHDLFISGESYAGMYVPFVVNQLHHHKVVHQRDPDVFKPNLKGFMVGNGCTNWKYDTEPAYLKMAYWHSLYSQETYDAMQAEGCDFSAFANMPSAACMTLYGKFAADVDKVNVYNIFGYCYGLTSEEQLQKIVPGATERGLTVVEGQIKSYKKSFSAKDYTPWASYRWKYAEENNIKITPPCVDGTSVIAYMNQADVRTALYIPSTYPAWDMCNDQTFNYTVLEIGSQWIYEALKGEYRMLHFSGDIDGAVPTDGTYSWIQSMNPTIIEEFRPWTIEGGIEVGGYIEEYDGLTFATVHGAGHMVPQDKPQEAYHLIYNWMRQHKI